VIQQRGRLGISHTFEMVGEARRRVPRPMRRLVVTEQDERFFLVALLDQSRERSVMTSSELLTLEIHLAVLGDQDGIDVATLSGQNVQ